MIRDIIIEASEGASFCEKMGLLYFNLDMWRYLEYDSFDKYFLEYNPINN